MSRVFHRYFCLEDMAPVFLDERHMGAGDDRTARYGQTFEAPASGHILVTRLTDIDAFAGVVVVRPAIRVAEGILHSVNRNRSAGSGVGKYNR